MAQRAHYQEEHQKWSNSTESTDEQVTENGDHRRLRDGKAEDDTNDQTADDTFDQIDAVPFLNQVFHNYFSSFLLCENAFTVLRCNTNTASRKSTM